MHYVNWRMWGYRKIVAVVFLAFILVPAISRAEVPSDPLKRVPELVEGMDNDDFDVREAATADLQNVLTSNPSQFRRFLDLGQQKELSLEQRDRFFKMVFKYLAGKSPSNELFQMHENEEHQTEDYRQVSLELLVERFGPFWDLCKKLGITFDLECHPSERAMGDIESASDYINFMCKAGYESVVGFNLDGSHMEWQGVSVIQFIREFKDFIHCAHIKGVQVSREHTRAGLLGGHRPMGFPHNGWNFVSAGSHRDANSVEEIMIELNRVGYDGAVNIEWEDNDVEQHAGARSALAFVRQGDLPPSGMKHDEAFAR